jgi:m7GpppX diphosphatase
VHVSLESGATQAIGKALSLENIVSQLETMQGGPEVGMHDVDLTYGLGEASELWEKVFNVLKTGRVPDVAGY